MNDVSNELDLLLANLPNGVRSAAILGSPVAVIAARLRMLLPKATLHVIAENAREFDDAVAGRHTATVGTDFSVICERVDMAILRVGGYEGKQRLEERIRSARNVLGPAGALFVLTHTKRGAKGQLSMMEETFASAEVAARGGGGYRVLSARQNDEVGLVAIAPVQSEEVSFVVEDVLGMRVKFRTNGAVFSKDRIDAGTRLLLEALPAHMPERVVDVGCGYGAMGIVVARRFPETNVTMLDIDAQAVSLAQANVTVNNVAENTRVVLSNGFTALPGERFGLALIHFPLHVARDVLEALLEQVRDALAPDGCLYGVMLRRYELRPLVQRVFGNVETLRETDGNEQSSAYAILKASRSRISTGSVQSDNHRDRE
jgi:16S rRNA (guanine1207-N2)-methyltransferase